MEEDLQVCEICNELFDSDEITDYIVDDEYTKICLDCLLDLEEDISDDF